LLELIFTTLPTSASETNPGVDEQQQPHKEARFDFSSLLEVPILCETSCCYFSKEGRPAAQF